MLTEFGFSGGLNTASLKRAQEIKAAIQKEKHKRKRIADIKRALNTKDKAEREKNMAPYELFLKRLKQKEKNIRRNIINKKAWHLYRLQRKKMLKQLDLQNPEYKVLNKWRLNAYRDKELTRSLSGLTAGKAWDALRKSWVGYRLGSAFGNIEEMKYYAEGIQKYMWLLEEPPVEFETLKGIE